MPRSATQSRPCASKANACGVRNSPCRTPIWPHSLMKVPSTEYFRMRAVRPASRPSLHRLVGRHTLTAVAVGDEDAPVRRGNHVVGLVELVRSVAWLPRRAEAHQELAVGAELVHLMPLRPVVVTGEIRHPDVALRVDMDAVRGDHDAAAEVGEYLTRCFGRT